MMATEHDFDWLRRYCRRCGRSEMIVVETGWPCHPPEGELVRLPIAVERLFVSRPIDA